MNTKLLICSSMIMQILFAGQKTAAQVTPTPVGDSININNVSALMYADGVGFWNQTTNMPAYRVPKTGKACTIYAAGLWIGGFDAGGKLHTTASTYKQNGTDVWPGPMMDSLDYSSHQDSLWNHIWKVNKSTIDSFRQGKLVTIPASIKNWPGDGNVALGEMAQLAPYVDSNHNGYYDPSGGDYPLIRGDQAMYMIFNDDRGLKHTETGGLKLGIEIHLMAYQFKIPSDTAVDQTTFLHYDVYNRSKNTYNNVYLGYYCDMDLGNGANDYVGCDSANNYWYTYNGTATDPNGVGSYTGEIGYGGPTPPPPAQGVVYLCDTMTHFQFYNNDMTVMGNPKSDTMYYNYMKSIWGDGSHVRLGGNGHFSDSTNTNYMFSGDPASNTGWTCSRAGMPPYDMRGLSSVGPFIFAAGSSRTLDLALVFSRARIGNQNTSVTTLNNAVSYVKNFYATQSYACDKTLLSIDNPAASVQNMQVKLYPNPNKGVFQLKITNYELGINSRVEVYNMLGEKVYSTPFTIHNSPFTIDLSGKPAGVYMYRLITETGEQVALGKFIIN